MTILDAAGAKAVFQAIMDRCPEQGGSPDMHGEFFKFVVLTDGSIRFSNNGAEYDYEDILNAIGFDKVQAVGTLLMAWDVEAVPPKSDDEKETFVRVPRIKVLRYGIPMIDRPVPKCISDDLERLLGFPVSILMG